ncbi:hypothetical protein XPA_003499 [Xanthoria parietina]
MNLEIIDLPTYLATYLPTSLLALYPQYLSHTNDFVRSAGKKSPSPSLSYYPSISSSSRPDNKAPKSQADMEVVAACSWAEIGLKGLFGMKMGKRWGLKLEVQVEEDGMGA